MRFKVLLHTTKEMARSFFASIPLLGPLVYCKWEHHKACLKEMVVILVFSTATFWLTSAILMGYASTRNLGYTSIFLSTVKNGELFIFTVGFIGPILWHTAEDKANEKAFPGRLWHLLILILVGLFATAYHSQSKLANLSGKIIPEDAYFLFLVSIGLATAAVVLRYLAMVYRKSTATFKPQVEIKDPEKDFVEAYAEHRAQEATR